MARPYNHPSNDDIKAIFMARYGQLRLDEDGVPVSASNHHEEGIAAVMTVADVCKAVKRTTNTVSGVLNNPRDHWNCDPKLIGWIGHRAAEMRASL